MTLSTIESFPKPEELIIPQEPQPLRHFTITAAELRNGEVSNHRIRSDYVEEHWLPFVGPNAMLFARKCDLILSHDNKAAVRIAAWANGFSIDEDALMKSIHRLIRYGLANWSARDTTLLLLRFWPTVPTAILTSEHAAVLRSLPDRVDFYLDYVS